jgi:hypothetical protein
MEAESYDRYNLAMYWRYLYEQFNGMEVVRVGLEEMTRHYDPDVVSAIAGVMNSAFARIEGPVRSYEESLIGFARAAYALGLENGRCATEDLSACGGYFYDPHGMYANPALEARIEYKGGTRAFDGAVPASFGMDFIEVSVDRELQSQPVTITFQAKGTVARFNVQIWELGRGQPNPRALTPVPETTLQNSADAPVNAVLLLDRAQCEGLAIIITRLDADEAVDPAGSYRITLTSAIDTSTDQGTVKPLVGADGQVAW